MTRVLVVGAGPAGVVAAIRAAQLGASTTLATSGAFGGMAANDGPAPVRTLAHAARLMREARQLPAYGIEVGEPRLDYRGLLGRVAEVVAAVGEHSALRPQAEAAGVVVREHLGPLRFVAADALESAAGERFGADRIILCTGGVGRRFDVPGAELVASHSDAWSLTEVPRSMLVIGAGATGMQVASVFNAFGTRVQLFQAGPRIIPTEDEEVSVAVAQEMRRLGVEVHEDFGVIERFEKTPAGIRMVYARDGQRLSAEADLAVRAIGWTAETAGLNLAAAGVDLDARGFIAVDEFQHTTAAHVWAAGDVTGGLALVPQALQEGFAAATNVVTGAGVTARHEINPIGSFTDPEYAQVGLSEQAARAAHEIETAVARFDSMTRGIVDGHTVGFCKLVVDRSDHRILGCHVVGDRAIDTAQIAAVAMAGGLTVDALARLPLSFPTYAGILARAAAAAAFRLNDAQQAGEGVRRPAPSAWVAMGAALAMLAAVFAPPPARAQDDGARVYQLAPEGRQVLTGFLVVKRGNEGPDPGQTSPESETRTDTFVVRYARTLSLLGRQLTPFAILPVGQLKVKQGQGAGGESSGFGDAQLGTTLGLVGAPALDPAAYVDFRPTFSTSLLGRVFFPTGDYSRDQPVNLGANRFSYQLGLPTTFMFGQSYADPRLTALEVLPTVTFYSPNHAPFGADVRTQAPLFSLEAHLTHNLPNRIWVSADLLYRSGGESRTDDVDNHDPVHGWSAGATVALPVVGRTSLALTYEHVVKRWDLGPDGWFFRTALIAPF